MGAPSAPSPPTPTQAAQAQALTQNAGIMENIGSMPQQAYAEALDQIAFNPIFQQVQSATQANSGLANAKANQAISAAVNPYGTSGANAFNREASTRLASVMNQPMTPGLTQTNTAGVYGYPNSSELPNLNDVVTKANAIAQSLPTISMTPDTVGLVTHVPTNGPIASGPTIYPPMQSQPFYFS